VRYTPTPESLQSISARLRRSLAVVAVVAALFVSGAARAVAPSPLRSAKGAVASDHPSASAAGAELLRQGGNAADAACATALALGVTNSYASGMGGGGFALVYVAKEKRVYALDFREKAPGGARPEQYFKDGKPVGNVSRKGGLAVGVPGEVRGLGELVRRFGKKGFADCVKPAEKLAKGFPATDRLLDVINGSRRSPEGAKVVERLYTWKEPLTEGATIVRQGLGATLAKLRQKGPDAFYAGPIAEAIVKAVGEAGGAMTLEDLRAYNVVDRKPLEVTYRGKQVFCMPPPSSGGLVLAEALGVLAARVPDPKALGHGSSAYLHLLAEALKHGFADRARHLGDTDFVEVPLAKLTDPAYHKELAARLSDTAVLQPEKYGLPAASGGPAKDKGTAHLSVIDAEGNAVALTTTVNHGFGSWVVAGDTGIVLNNQMDDFSLAPETPNGFGLIGYDKNLIAPGKRPLSSMSPTIVLDGGGVRLAVGGAGGPTIISGTLQVLLNVLDFGMDVQQASSAPRVHHQWRPNTLAHEPEVPKDVQDALERRGHKTAQRGHLSLVNAVARTKDGVEAAAELRGSGRPAAP
jgi:gamma-glutamyltranspeptidase/glutathione hydrolase